MKKLLLLFGFLFAATAAFGQQVINLDNLYCPSTSGVPTWAQVDGPATLPLICLQTSLANTPATGSVVSVTTAAQLTTALAAATCGQKITLQAGNVFSGNFTVPSLACPSTNWLWIQSSAVASLPPEAARYSTSYIGSGGISQTVYAPKFGPCYSGVTSQAGRPPLNCPSTAGTYTAQLVSPNSTAVLTFNGSTTNIRFIGLEITRTPGTGVNASLVALGNQGTGISGIYFDRVWAHGDENQDETGRFLSVSGVSNFAMVDSYCNNFYFISVIGTGTDSKCIAGGANTISSTTETGMKLVNNFIEASGENILFGGAASNTVWGDGEIRLNLFFKPLQWNPSDPSYNGGISGNALIVKNSTEFKNGQRILYEGNQIINSWGGFSQIGHAFLITPVNQNNGSGPLCPICGTYNITARYNTANTVGAGMELDEQLTSGSAPAGGNHYSIHDWVIDNLNYPTCFGCSSGSTVSMYNNLSVTPTSALAYIDVNHMTFVYPTTTSFTIAAALGLSGLTGSSIMNNITVTNNVMQTWGGTTNSIGGTQPTNCAQSITSGSAMIAACWQPNTVSGNCFVNNGLISWPAGNTTSVASYSALFTSYSNGDGGNYTIASGSACKAAGTDGMDPGAYVLKVASVIAGTSATPTPQWAGAEWNHINYPTPPPVWPPVDGNGATASLFGAGFWDDGNKLGNLCPSGPCTISWTSGAGRQLSNFINVLAPSSSLIAPMILMYDVGDVPSWAAQGTDSNCSATQGSSSCVPFSDMDTNQATCNATPNSTGTSNATVLANCGNGTNATFESIFAQIVIQFKGKGMAYQCWNEPDGSGIFWSNSATYGGLGHAPTLANQPPLTRLVRICADELQIITQLDPTATLILPSVHGPTWSSWWPLFAGTSVNIPACTGSCSSVIGGATWPAYTATGATLGQAGTLFNLTGLASSASGWTICVLPSCNPGGTGNATGTLIESSGVLDATCSGPADSNCLFYYNNAATDSASAFVGSWAFTLGANGQTANAYEFDFEQYLIAPDGGTANNTRLTPGSQCVIGHNWQIWDGPTGWHDISPAISCSLPNGANAVTWYVHRVPGDTSCSGGYPKVWYDTLIVNAGGTVNSYAVNNSWCSSALPGGFAEKTIIQFQTDIGASGATLTENLSSITFTGNSVTTGTPWAAATCHCRGQTNNADPTQFLAMYADMQAAIAIPSNGLPVIGGDFEWGQVGATQSVNLNTTAGFIAESLVLRASVPLTGQYYYEWDNGTYFPAGTIAGTAWDTAFKQWVLGSLVNQTTNSGTVYTTAGVSSAGKPWEVLFDSSQTCTTSSCATANQSAGSFTNYEDIFGGAHTVSGGVVPVGFQPIYLYNLTNAGAATPTFSPGAGTYGGAQSVTISSTSAGAIICYNTTGAPSTNGSTGCNVGTLYSGAVSVAASETLYAVAGGTGYSDSSVGSAVYSIGYTLTQTVTGLGTVSSSPAGILNCASGGGTCSASFSSGTAVTLTATAGSNYLFSTWGGACAAFGSTPVATVVMNAAESCSATFVQGTPPAPAVSVQGFVL